MEIEDWTGRIMCNKKRSRNINLRIEPELIDILKKMENRSEFIRKAIKEKLKSYLEPYLVCKTGISEYEKHKFYKV